MMNKLSPAAGLAAKHFGCWDQALLPSMVVPTLIATMGLSALAGATQAQLGVKIVDHRGRPVEQAVVLVFPEGGVASNEGAVTGRPAGVMDQVDETFAPQVLVVPKGLAVEFPNHDDVRHHVYSFSEAKKFELPLYEGKPANPVVFDQEGPVVLGCNIHDWMRGYIYVTAAPFSALSVEGKAMVAGLRPGDYRVEVWHPRLRSKENWTGTVTVDSAGGAGLDVEIRLKPEIKIRRAPKAGAKKY